MTHTSTEQPEARIAELEAQLIAEAARTAEQKLRADQLEQQHAMQAKMHAQAVEQLAAAQQGAQDAEPAAWVATFKPEGLLALHSVVGANLEELKQSVPGNSVFRPLYTHPAPQGHSITDALEALQEAEAALEVACARLEKQRADYPVGVTSEGKALMLVRKVLAAQAKQGGA